MSLTDSHSKSPLNLVTIICSNIHQPMCYVCHSESALHCSAEVALNAWRCCWYDQVRFMHVLYHVCM